MAVFQITPQFGLPIFSSATPDTSEFENLRAVQKRLALDEGEGRLLATRSEQEQVRHSGRYSPHGVQLEAARIAAKHQADFRREADQFAKQIRRAIDERGAKLLAPQVRQKIPEGADRQLVEMRDREARDLLRQMPEAERESVYLDAAREGKQDLLRAIELAPVGFELVDAATIEKGARLFAEHLDAAMVREMDAQHATLEHIRGVAQMIDEHFVRLGGIAPEPVPVVAENAAY